MCGMLKASGSMPGVEPKISGTGSCRCRCYCESPRNTTLFETISRSKRKRRTYIFQGTMVLYLILLSLFPSTANAQDRVTSEEITLFVDENQPPGTYIGTVAGAAGDRITNSYLFLSSSPPQEFHLNRTSGIITTTVRIDRESLSNDLFQLPVTISYEDGMTEVVELSIKVNDINDNSPAFPQPVIAVSFSENAHTGSVKVLPSAMDADKDAKGYINLYLIEDGNQDGVFALQTFRPRSDAEYTVSLVTAKLLDRETEPFYVLNISATDNGTDPRTGYLTINVSIEDVNDNSPIFTQTTYRANVNESAAAGTSVIRVEATDLDVGSNGEIVYSLKTDISNDLMIDPDTGWIVLLRQLPYVAVGYNIEVQATDRGVPAQSSTAFLTITIVDENDHSPLIEVTSPAEVNASSMVTLQETNRPTSLVFTLSVSDEDTDQNGRVNLTIFSGNQQKDFTLATYAFGNLFIAVLSVSETQNIDREITPKYNLTFKAQDYGSPSLVSYRSFIINIVDENDHAPVFMQESYVASLNETVQIGSYVQSVTATDADEGINAAIIYAITGDEYGWFSIDNKTGLVVTHSKLDRERTSQVTLNITATDQGTTPMSNSTTLTIHILDDNDEYPVFNQTTYNIDVTENAPPMDLLQVSASDKDSGVYGIVMFALKNSQDATKFSMGQTSGMLRTIVTLDREDVEQYEIEIIAYDGGLPPLMSSATVSITVMDVNDNVPQFYPIDYYASVIENGDPGMFITAVSAIDLDSGSYGAITYIMSDSTKFQIDSNSGNITSLVSLDREEEATYTLTISALDGGKLTSAQNATVHILVTDTLDNPLEFEQNPYRFQLEENQPNSTVVGMVRATSLDLNVEITYVITGGDPNNLFDIDFYSGEIRSRRSVDREAQDSDLYRLTVYAIDGSQNGQTVVEVEILDINDNAPIFSVQQDQVDVVENWAVGYNFYAAQVTDADNPPNNIILYELSQNVDNRFAINRTSGVLFINKDLQSYSEREYILQIRATDYGTPPLSSTLDLVVNVRDVNNNAPMFSDSINTTLSILESTQVNTRFVQVVATDADQGTNGDITYRITQGNEADSFGIFPDGVVYVKQELDREQIDHYELTVEASDGGVPSLSSLISLNIFILDENDNRPLFDNATYNFFLPEEQSVGFIVGTLHAIDNDVGDNGNLLYSFTSNQTNFAMNSATGVITSKVTLDRESLLASGQPITFTARVRVRDDGNVPLQDNAEVHIHIMDINDNAPVFNREYYQASISELAQNETLIIRVSATDADEGDNSYIIYSIVNVSGNGAKKFHIDHSSGQISLVGTLDREVEDSYNLMVKARDSGTIPQETFIDVEISVLDENDHSPIFEDPLTEIEVTECLEIGDEIGLFHANDLDINSNGEITYTITAGNLDAVFGVNSRSGEVYLTGLLDHEATSQYHLNITARDGGSPSQTSVASLVINVRDCNDNSPVFAYVGVPEIDEEKPEGFQVVRLQASDSDSGVNGEIYFSIVNQQPLGGFFTIDPISGWVTTTSKTIDRESEDMSTDQFILTIQATDQAIPTDTRRTASVEVVIFIRDINDNAPTFTSQHAAILSRSTSPNTAVTSVNADDPDAGVNGQVTYELVTSGVPFRLDLNSGVLTLTQSLTTSISVYSLEVKAKDAGSSQQQTTFTLTIIISVGLSDVLNFAEDPYTRSVSENQPVGTDIVTVFASYADNRDATVEYYVVAVMAGSVEKGSLIVADPNSGIIRTGAVLDREDFGSGSSLEATVIAVDTISSSSSLQSVQVVINVRDQNDNAPIFSNAPYNVSIVENSPANSPVATVTATDADLGSNSVVSYRIIDGATDLFALDSTTGEMTTRGAVDRETLSVYHLVLEASDHTLTSTTTMDIHLLDENDNQPLFSMAVYSFILPEDEDVGEEVGVIMATDTDAGTNGEIVYSVVEEGAPGEDVFFLDPITGAFRLQQTLDYEMRQHYHLTVMGTDRGTPPQSSTCRVYINVADVNDNTPLFSPAAYSEEVPEDVAVGTTVVTLTATDLDSGGNGDLYFTIVSGDPMERFMVLSNGTIATASSLDREQESFYNLEVVASDYASDPALRLSSTAQVSIIVTDMNDNAPYFTNTDSTTVPENTRVNTIIMVLHAQDADVERNSYVEYSLLTPSVPFAVSKVEGNMFVTGTLDRETVPVYTILVQATDKGSPPQSSRMNITISIQDINDNTPTFDPDSYSADLDEDTPVGLEFLKVTATDPDEGLNSLIRYSIFSGNNNQAFFIDPISGVISVNSGLDYEHQTTYSLTVRAQDQGFPTQISSITVSIDVLDINDNKPVFADSYAPSITENNLPHAHIVQVSATDADSGTNGIITYSLKSDHRGLFTIGSTSGLITATGVLDYEEETTYELIVIAEDAGSPAQQSLTRMILSVLDDNDHDPVFFSDSYRASISEAASPGAFVLQVTATDVDATADLRYQLNDDVGSKFTIDPVEGRIITSGVLDRETQSSYSLTVTVHDGSTRRSSTSVFVEVTDINDNPPHYQTSSYSTLLPSSTTRGRYVAAVQASDADSGSNADVTYTISNGDTSRFVIDASTGVVSTAQDLPNENGFYDLVIAAQNPTGSHNSAMASLRVEFSAASFPTITAPASGVRFSYSESVPAGATVTTVAASSSVTFSIVGGNFGEFFNVDSQSGEVTIAKQLNYEEAQSFSLWIQASDGSNPPRSDYVQVQVLVTDENDNSPVFAKTIYSASVVEEQTGQVDVVTLSAVDLDSGSLGTVTYSIESGNYNNAFTIHPTSGLLETAGALDREQLASYQLTVLATDGGNPARTGSAIVIVAVLDVNDNSMNFAETYVASIPENAPPGTHVVVVHATDPDETNLSHYLLEAGGTSSLFAIDKNTGEITVNGSLDYETDPVHDLLVRAYDSVHSVQTDVTVSVQDVNNNAPKFQSSIINETYPESFFNRSGGVLFLTLSANDRDSGDNGRIEFILKTLTDMFRVDTIGNTAFIYYSKPIPYITPSQGDLSDPNEYTFGVFAVDHGVPAMYSEATVIIRVTQSHMPVFEMSSYISPVTAGIPANSQIIQVVAVDQSTGASDDVKYSVFGGNGTSKFDVEASTGWIIVKDVSLEENIDSVFQLIVKATIGDTIYAQPANTTVSLLVTDTNLYPPTFTAQNYPSSVLENLEDAMVTTVLAADDDDGINGEIVYSLQGADATLFSIDETSGAINVIGSLDREVNEQYQFQVVATDKAMHSMSSTATVTVTVLDDDDSPPVFSPDVYTAEVYENSPTATPVVTVAATDADLGSNAQFTYAINGDNDYFTIDEQTGQILTQGNFDYEAGKTTFYLTAAATNEDATLVGLAHVTVNLLGVNEYYPQFSKHQYEMYVNEHAADGYPVGFVLATDMDRGDDGLVYYLFIGGSNSKGFSIDSETGYIYVNTANGILDRENEDTITLSVLAKNDGPIVGDNVDEAEVIIHIQDGNDPPVFTSDQYQARVVESASIGTDITTVTAQDYDEEQSFKQFGFSILEGNIEGAFEINAESGNIRTATELDREIIPVYYLTVAAIDTGNPSQTGTTNVIVQLDDINDNGPVFLGDNANGFVYENQPINTAVMTLNATDPDENSNPVLFTFIILPNQDSSAFKLVGKDLLTTQTLDREVKADYYLNVEASDGESPSVTATSTIHINVADRNDNPSSSRQARIEVKMYQSNFGGGIIGSVQPIDPDTDDVFSCAITSGDTSRFSIQSNCHLHSNAQSVESQLTVEVSGNAGSHPSVTSTFTVAYEAFTDDTLTNSVTLRLVNTDATTFLSQSYDLFKTSLSTFLSSLETLIALSITDYPSTSKVDLLIAVKKQGGHHLSKADLIQLLTENEATIESQSGITIQTIDYTACSDDPCKNSGICSGQTNIDLDERITESDPIILVGIQINHTFSCECTAEYSGDVCEIPTDYCQNSICQNGATCQNDVDRYFCQCLPGYEGDLCETDINECLSNPCQNGAICDNHINGFFCDCPPGYTGIFCEIGPCSTGPCENDGTCTESGDTFECQCDDSHWGIRCEYTTIGFQGGSYLSRSALPSSGSVIQMEFSTTSTNALMFYNHDSYTDLSANYVALEVVDGRLELSFNFGSGQSSISVGKIVNDGLWHEVEVRLQGSSVDVTILDEDCPRLAPTACSASTSTSISLNFDGTPFMVGGVADISEITNRPFQVSAADFVGCMNGIYINGIRLHPGNAKDSHNLVEGCSRESSGCGHDVCPDGSACVDEWWTTWCQCEDLTPGSPCTQGNDAFETVSLGDGAFVWFRIKEANQRQALLDQAKASGRRRRATDSQSLHLSFRTETKNGLLLYITSDMQFTAIQLKNGSVHYSYGDAGVITGEITVMAPSISDWEWHNVSMTSTGGQVTLGVDNQQKSATFSSPHAFTSLDLTGMWLGGTEEPVSINGKSLQDFSGCVDGLTMNGELLPLEGDSQRFEAIPSDDTGKGCTGSGPCSSSPCGQGESCVSDGSGYTCMPSTCASNTCQNGGTCTSSAGGVECECLPGYKGDLCETEAMPAQGGEANVVAIVAPLVVVALIIVLVVFLVYFMRRRKQMKTKKLNQNAALQNPKVSVLSSTDNPGFMGDTFDDATMIGGDRKVNNLTMMGLSTPDIIEQNMGMQNDSNPSNHSTRMERDTGEHVNIEMNVRNAPELDEAEHYDLENASSLAASDIDVAYHYKHYHDHDRMRKKKKHRRPNQNPLLDRIQASPARLSPVSVASRHSPNPLSTQFVHSTPLHRQSPGLHSNYSTNNTLRMGSVPNSGRATPAMGLASPVASEHSYGSELRSQAHHSDISSLRSVSKPARVASPLPLPHLDKPSPSPKGRDSKSPVVGLTAEEVAQLNTARPDLMSGSHGSTMDDLSSDDSRRHHAAGRHGDHTPIDPSHLLEPPDSTSDDTNDSFTCSEMESEYKVKFEKDFSTEAAILSRLAEIEQSEDSVLPHVNGALKQKKLDSRGGSLNTLCTSEEDNGHPKPQRTNGDVTLDRLLGWGPRFDNLIGVFKDIAQLHETNGTITLHTSLTHEEFV